MPQNSYDLLLSIVFHGREQSYSQYAFSAVPANESAGSKPLPGHMQGCPEWF